jgi:predicted DNA-binding transcriptional regulator AlpA
MPVARQSSDPLAKRATDQTSDLGDKAESAGVMAISSTSADGAPLVIDAEELACLLKISVKTLDRQLTAKKLPRPILIGRQRRWPLKEIVEWLAAGAPAQREWDQLQRAKQGPLGLSLRPP